MDDQTREDAARWRRVQKNPFAAIDALKTACDAHGNGQDWVLQANRALDVLRDQWGDAAPADTPLKDPARPMVNQRQQLTQDQLEQAALDVYEKVCLRVFQKGLGTLASNHEILGIISQETTEYEEAVHLRWSNEAKVEELKDIAVGAIFGIASIESDGVDW